MKKALRIIGLIAAGSLLASCGLFGDEDEELEPMELVDIDQVVKVKKIWGSKVGGKSEFLRVALRPASDGSRIYAASYDGNVIAYDPESGSQVWRTELDIELTAGPGVGEGYLVVVAKDGFAVLLNTSTGEEMWRADIAGESLAKPLIKGNSVIVQTIDNRIQALSVFDGDSRWSIVQTSPALTMRGSSTPVNVGNTVIAGFDSGRLVCADIDNGTIIWESLLSPPKGRSDLDRLSDIDGSMAVVGQDLYASGYQGRLAAIAAESGQILWNREISSYEGVAADWTSVYTVSDNGEIVALGRQNGNESWRNGSLLRREPTLPVPFGTTVVVGDLEGYLHFFNTIDGEAVARVRIGGGAITADPFVMANRLFVQSDSGQLVAYVLVEDRPKRTAAENAEDES